MAIEPRPPGGIKLTGTDFWRLRVGDLRLIYLIDVDRRVAIVLKVARRSERTYRRVEP